MFGLGFRFGFECVCTGFGQGLNSVCLGFSLCLDWVWSGFILGLGCVGTRFSLFRLGLRLSLECGWSWLRLGFRLVCV